MHTNFTNLINLNEIWLYENEFTGSIPEFTVNVELRHVYLYNNYFSGPAPQLNTLAALQFLFLSSNKLTGVVPNYENSPLLTHFSIARNKMTGISPHTVATFFGLEVYDVRKIYPTRSTPHSTLHMHVLMLDIILYVIFMCYRYLTIS